MLLPALVFVLFGIFNVWLEHRASRELTFPEGDGQFIAMDDGKLLPFSGP
jgi:hypothetical protein